MRTIVLPAKLENLNAMREFTGQAARDAGMDDAEVYAVKLAVDEACTNIIEHAYREEAKGKIEITCNITPEGLTVILRDHGRSFDPSTVPAPDLSADLRRRRPGGLGLYLMRQLMDEIRFESLGEAGNVLTLIKNRRGTTCA